MDSLVNFTSPSKKNKHQCFPNYYMKYERKDNCKTHLMDYYPDMKTRKDENQQKENYGQIS